MYLHECDNWTSFTWDESTVLPLLSELRFAQGRLLGSMSEIGFTLESQTELETLTSEIIASSKIEGIALDAEKVRSSVSKQLGLDARDDALDTHEVDGAVDIMLDATKGYVQPLSHERLYGWHAALFPSGRSGLYKIETGAYRRGAMQVVSGAFGKEKVHYQAPEATRVSELMDAFIFWFNTDSAMEPLIKAGIAHLWFVSIHPFDDGNGRIARALTELLLARSDQSSRRYYSMAQQILASRKTYYEVLERTQKGGRDVTNWLVWFLFTLKASVEQSETQIKKVLLRAAFWQRLEGVQLNKRQRCMLEKLKGEFEGKLTSSKWAKMCKVSPDTALRDIKDLVDKGVLRQDTAGGRSTAFLLVEDSPVYL